MEKRGQATVFVIVGIVLVVLAALIFFYRDSITKAIRQEPINPQQYLVQQLDDVKKNIGDCVVSEVSEASKILMQNAGSYNREFNYFLYYGKKYPVLCRELEDKSGCLSEPLIVNNFQDRLNEKLPNMINNCLNLEAFKNEDYEINFGELKTSSTIRDKEIILNVDFPVELKKGVYSVKENNFVYAADVPLGELIKVVSEFVQKKASGEEIDPVGYMLINRNKYRLEVKKPYPDELYEVSLMTNNDYIFYFAVEGLGRFERTAVLK